MSKITSTFNTGEQATQAKLTEIKTVVNANDDTAISLASTVSGHTNQITNLQNTDIYLLDQVTAVNAKIGDIKIYEALLSNSGGTITAKVLINTIGAIVWSNPANGQVRGTLTGAFTADKTVLYNAGLNSYFVSGQRQSADFVRFFFTFFDNTATSTPNFTDVSVLIKVYV